MNLEYIHTTERRIRAKSNFAYDYYLKDHLGNIRIVFTDENNDHTPEVLQVDNYYLFGMRHGQANTFSSGSKTTQYMYNGKELQEDFNLDWYDYGARMYDPALARFSSIDPLTNNYRPFSPYHYALNNPVRYIDFQGMGAQEKGKDDPPPAVKVEYTGFRPNYSGPPLEVTGTLKGKLFGGRIGYSSGNKELLLSGNVAEVSISETISGDASETKGRISFLNGEIKGQLGDAGLAIKASAAEGEATINDEGDITADASAGNVKGEMAYKKKGASYSNSAWTSKSSGDSSVELVGGDNAIGSNEEKTTVTASASAAEVSVTVNHDNTANFVVDVFQLIQMALFGDELNRQSNGGN